MDSAIQQKADQWLQGNYDQETKEAVKKLQEDPKGLTEAFYQNLEFGTGGLRGIMGVGTNRMNKYTVGMATQGYANYLLQTYPGTEVRVAIAHDSRNNSRANGSSPSFRYPCANSSPCTMKSVCAGIAPMSTASYPYGDRSSRYFT